jgi:hypothetical protein
VAVRRRKSSIAGNPCAGDRCWGDIGEEQLFRPLSDKGPLDIPLEAGRN